MELSNVEAENMELSNMEAESLELVNMVVGKLGVPVPEARNNLEVFGHENFVQVIVPNVQSTKDALAAKETSAKNASPEGMEFVGWLSHGAVVTYPPITDVGTPVYKFIEQ